MVGARVPQDWQERIRAIAAVAGRKESEVVREAIAQYLGTTDPSSVKTAIASLEDRVIILERRLGRLAG
jgi:RHH-type rel operon transcriptional repressor/antitoxin RelB